MHNVIITTAGFYILVLYFPLALMLVYARPYLWHYTLAVFLGMLVGYIDANSSEVHLPVLLLLTFGFFFAVAKPRKPLLLILVLAVWAPAVEWIKIMSGMNDKILADGVGSLLAFVPAALGVYGGVLMHNAIGKKSSATNESHR